MRTLGFAFLSTPKKVLTKISHPKKVTTKFQTQKKSSDRKFQTQKRASHIPVAYIPEYPPWAFTFTLTLTWLTTLKFFFSLVHLLSTLKLFQKQFPEWRNFKTLAGWKCWHQNYSHMYWALKQSLFSQHVHMLYRYNSSWADGASCFQIYPDDEIIESDMKMRAGTEAFHQF